MPTRVLTSHPLIVQAKVLRDTLERARVYPERYPQHTPFRLERAAAKAVRRYERRLLKYGERVEHRNRRGRPDTKDRPYAVGGRGRRGW